jgi:hypothetical protein
MASGRRFSQVQGYNTNETLVGFHFPPTGSNGATITFTGSLGVTSVTKLVPGVYDVVLDDKFNSYHCVQVSLAMVSGTQNFVRPYLSSSTTFSDLHTSKAFRIGLSGAAGNQDLPGDPGNYINVLVIAKNSSGR